MTDETGSTATAFDYEAVKQLTGGPLATVVLDLIEDNVDRWNQSTWRQDVDSGGNYLQPCTGIDLETSTVLEAFAEDPLNPACTTSFCFAGWVGAVKGVKWAKGDQENVGDPDKCDCKTLCCTDYEHQISIAQFARDELGLALYEGELLFNGDNTLPTLRDMVEQLVETGSIDGEEDYYNPYDEEMNE